MNDLINKPLIKSKSLKKLQTGLKQQISEGLLIQGYCNSVQMQPPVDFSMDAKLKDIQTTINDSLDKGKTHANTYLTTIQPTIIAAVANLDNYFSIYDGVAVSLPPGSTDEQWIQSLTAVKQVSERNRRDAIIIKSKMENFSKNVSSDAANFKLVVSKLNDLVNGDNGELERITSELSSLDHEIAGAITSTGFEGLAILGGVVMIVVGAVADFVTAGTNPELVIGGVVAVVAGVGAGAGSIVVLANAYKKKAELLQEESSLKDEVKLVAGMSGAYTQLSKQIASAVVAANAMEAAWQIISDDLDSLINDLQDGILSSDDVRKMFLTEANTDIKILQGEIQVIKQQMAGVKTKTLPQRETIREFIKQHLN
ncbi:HBL/NHE enterotoxin family protein [Winogradskyella sp.]|uniref:HBL/NHE enterotoxin family protein n=1 Tax=Winogradskyella sp. TaxID=1883156 RepID=UPI003BA8F7A0